MNHIMSKAPVVEVNQKNECHLRRSCSRLSDNYDICGTHVANNSVFILLLLPVSSSKFTFVTFGLSFCAFLES